MKALLFSTAVVGLWASCALAQPIDVLVVDQTESLTESLAVNTIVGLMKEQSDLFATVDAVIAPVASPFDLPFLENPTGRCYDLVIVVPKGALALGGIWLATASYPQNSAPVWQAIGFLRALATQLSDQFDVQLSLQDIGQDLFAGILGEFFFRLGVLCGGEPG